MTDSVVKTEKRMKLFVAGQVFDDPRKWSQYAESELILAEDELQATALIGREVIEVRMDAPAVLR